MWGSFASCWGLRTYLRDTRGPPGLTRGYKVLPLHSPRTHFLGAVAFWPFAKTLHRAAFRPLLAIMRKSDGALSPFGSSATRQISFLAPSGGQISIWGPFGSPRGPFGSPRDRFPTISERLFAYFAPSNAATSQPHDHPTPQHDNLTTGNKRTNWQPPGAGGMRVALE